MSSPYFQRTKLRASIHRLAINIINEEYAEEYACPLTLSD